MSIKSMLGIANIKHKFTLWPKQKQNKPNSLSVYFWRK